MEFRQNPASVRFQIVFLVVLGALLIFTPFRWAGLGACLVIAAFIYLSARSEVLEVDERWVTYRQGILNKKYTKLALDKIETIDVKLAPNGSQGKITISTGDKKRIVFRSIEKPEAVETYINERRG